MQRGRHSPIARGGCTEHLPPIQVTSLRSALRAGRWRFPSDPAQAQPCPLGALALTDSERAELAAELLAALDGPRDQDVREAWAKEI
jgi:hypothetical protein